MSAQPSSGEKKSTTVSSNNATDAAISTPISPAPAATCSAADPSGDLDLRVPVQMRNGAALLMGINYRLNPAKKLFGCCNDARAIGKHLVDKCGFPSNRVKVVTDEDAETVNGTTYRGILDGLEDLCTSSWRDNLESAVIHFSGHGSQRVAEDRASEADGMDEVIVPSSSASFSCVSDNEMYSILRKFNPRTIIYCSFDCCHSGSILDLPYNYSPLSGEAVQHDARVEVATPGKIPRIALISGCRDSQLSADAWDDNARQAGGALTVSLLVVMARNQKITMRDLHQQVYADLRSKSYAQIPMMSSNFPMEGEMWLESM
jgi:hypothetical protein